MTDLNGDPVQRGANIVLANRFLTLATTNGTRPWSAPINYVIGPGHRLCWYSAHDSWHSEDIAKSNGAVAGAIYNSQASSEDVDGLQFFGRCSEAQDDLLQQIHSHYFEVNYDSDELRQWWYRPVDSFAAPARHRFYHLDLTEAYVIDYESINDDRLDQRISLNLEELWERIDQGPESVS